MDTVIGSILAFVIGVGAGPFLTDVAKMLFQYHLDNKKTEKLTKRELANKVIEICAEAKHSNYQDEPKDKNGFTKIVEQVNLYDAGIATLLQAIINTWMLTSTLTQESQEMSTNNVENSSLIAELQKFAVESHEVLVKKLKKWR